MAQEFTWYEQRHALVEPDVIAEDYIFPRGGVDTMDKIINDAIEEYLIDNDLSSFPPEHRRYLHQILYSEYYDSIKEKLDLYLENRKVR